MRLRFSLISRELWTLFEAKAWEIWINSVRFAVDWLGSDNLPDDVPALDASSATKFEDLHMHFYVLFASITFVILLRIRSLPIIPSSIRITDANAVIEDGLVARPQYDGGKARVQLVRGGSYGQKRNCSIRVYGIVNGYGIVYQLTWRFLF